jgi:hypothetical protein
MVLGALSFFASFFFQNEFGKKITLATLSLAVSLYLLPVFYSIIKAKIQNFTIRGIFIAVIFGISGLILGLHLLASHAFGHFPSSHISLANLHIVLSVFGFVGLLIVAVAHQVLPMFFVAPNFPEFCKKFVYVFAALLVVFACLIFAGINAELFIKISIAVFMSAFATVALKKIKERRRKISDTSLKYWQIGLVSLIVGSILLLASLFIELVNADYIFAVIFGIGFIGSIIKAMLNKIVPFLVWFHLTSEGNFDAPNINDLLPQKIAMVEFWLHNIAFILLIIGFKHQLFITIGGIFLSLSFLFLASNLYEASKFYARVTRLR